MLEEEGEVEVAISHVMMKGPIMIQEVLRASVRLKALLKRNIQTHNPVMEGKIVREGVEPQKYKNLKRELSGVKKFKIKLKGKSQVFIDFTII